MSNCLITYLTSMLLLTSSLAHANIEIRFIESAPKDRFVLNNTGQCAIQDATVTIDLSDSTGKLIFDTTATGAGVEVFQPFETSDTNLALVNSKQVKDGATRLSIKIANLKASDSTYFTIDVDDTLKQSELGNIRVSGSEINNATIEVTSKNIPTSKATFNQTAEALLTFTHC